MSKSTKSSPTKAQLRHKLVELEAQLAHAYHFASYYLDKTSTDRLMGSGVLIQMHFLGGKEAVLPVVIKDGLSKETINSLKADLLRSYEKAVEFKPQGAKV
jgi:hypothetical protein